MPPSLARSAAVARSHRDRGECTASAAGSGVPLDHVRGTRRAAARTRARRRRPRPASRSTGSRSGVLATASRAAPPPASSTPASVVSPSLTARSTDSAAERTTVRMVPSTGRSTAS